MGKKMIYSVILNLGIILLAYCLFASFNGNQYYFTAMSVIGIALLIYLKINLLKSIRNTTKH